MTTVVVEDVTMVREPARPRWLLAISGVLWLLVAIAVLSFTPTSAATIGFMMGAVIIFAGIDEIAAMTVAESWRWLHGIAGGVFVVFGILALVAPFQTFGILALFVGWYLVVKGFFDMALAIGLRGIRPLWGLTLALGIGESLLGIWALGYPGRSAWLLVLWVGFGAMFRGVGDLVASFGHGGRV